MKPINITANRSEAQMTVQWDDEHTSIYPFSLLRAGCPCAECRGGHEGMSDLPDPQIFSVELPDSPATHLAGVSAVGTYGISPAWVDGHAKGIYTWRYLRALCPCGECRKE